MSKCPLCDEKDEQIVWLRSLVKRLTRRALDPERMPVHGDLLPNPDDSDYTYGRKVGFK